MGPIQNPFSFPIWIPHGYPIWGLYSSPHGSYMGPIYTCCLGQFTSNTVFHGGGGGGGFGHLEILFCLKLSKKTEKLLNEQPTHAITKCSLTGLVQRLRSLIGSEIWSHACVFSTTCANWNSKWRCRQRKSQRPQPAYKGNTGSQTLN